jgi:transmembrane sensor
MMNLSAYHQSLLLGKITRSLSASENEELNLLLNENAEIKEAYEDLILNTPSELLNTEFERIKKPEYWDNLSQVLNKRKTSRKRLIVKWSALIAILIGLTITGWIYLPNNTINSASSAIAKKDEGIQLKLANGKMIDLSRQHGNIIEGSTKMVNNNQSLSYSDNENESGGINSVFVPAGKDYEIVLSDGSKIRMNSTTKLDFPFTFSANTREITINGEAYCEIAKDKKRPFIVHLPTGSVKVLGTEFNVNSYTATSARVSLVEGKISVSDGKDTLTLSPGKQAVLNGQHLTQQSFNAKKELSWIDGLFYLDEADINTVAEVLTRWYGIKVVVDTKELYTKRFAGVINKKLPLSVFLDDLKAIAKITHSFDNNGILHFN